MSIDEVGGRVDRDPGYPTTLDHASIERIATWHERAYQELRAGGDDRVTVMGLDLDVPSDVYGPTPIADLLGSAILAEVRPSDRVLDMGTGSGINAILAASVAREVIGADINPSAVKAAKQNAFRNRVGDRTVFLEGDLFGPVAGTFDLVIFDPPFRWFKPRDMLERSITDEGYQTLTRFMSEVPSRLSSDGRILMCFGTTGDLAYLHHLIAQNGLKAEILNSRESARDGNVVYYYAFRLIRMAGAERADGLSRTLPSRG